MDDLSSGMIRFVFKLNSFIKAYSLKMLNRILSAGKQLLYLIHKITGLFRTGRQVPKSASTLSQGILNSNVPKQEKMTFDNVRILIAHHDSQYCALIANRLASWGIEPFSASNGSQTLELARSFAEFGRPFDIALLELHMPGTDGFELAIMFQNDLLISGTSLILLNSGPPLDKKVVLAAGFYACLGKPFSESQLNSYIAEIIKVKAPGPVSSPLAEEKVSSASRLL
jgi:CheY-like chemotaxis protein